MTRQSSFQLRGPRGVAYGQKASAQFGSDERKTCLEEEGGTGDPTFFQVARRISYAKQRSCRETSRVLGR
jgi:hypothetical protein